MISFVKKGDPQPPQPPKAEPKPSDTKDEDNRFEQIRKAAAEERRKSDVGGRDQQAAEDNRLL